MRLAGEPSLPDHWHASAVTTPADLAPFTPADLDEARSRLTRLAQIWRVRLRPLGDERLDRAEGDAWTLRQIAFHLGNTYYADAVGDLTARPGRPDKISRPTRPAGRQELGSQLAQPPGKSRSADTGRL